MFIRYGLRSTQTIQHINSVNPAIERFSFTTKGRWEEVFTTAHHTIWKERLYIEYGILASFLNKVDSMQEIDFTTKNVHKKGFNLKRKTYLTLGIGYQHTIK
jgi:hypothetical protein